MVYKYLNGAYELKKPAFLVAACNPVSDNPGHFKCKICHFRSFFHVVMLAKVHEHFFFFPPYQHYKFIHLLGGGDPFR